MLYLLLALPLSGLSLDSPNMRYSLPRPGEAETEQQERLCPLKPQRNPSLNYSSGLDFGLYYGRPYYYAPYHYYYSNSPYFSDPELTPYPPYRRYYGW